MNKHTQIETLLSKYWECETTIQEEQILKTYFSKDDVAPEFEEFRSLFQYFTDEAAITREIDIDAVERAVRPKVKQLTFSRRLISVAASLLLLATVIFMIKDQINPVKKSSFASHEVQDSEEALEVTMEALAFLSKKLDKSSDDIRKDLKSVAAADILR